MRFVHFTIIVWTIVSAAWIIMEADFLFKSAVLLGISTIILYLMDTEDAFHAIGEQNE